jgi:hypothetical protein
MTLSNDDIMKLGQRQRLKFKALRGKKKGDMITLDMLAAAVAVVCNSKPDGCSISVAYTTLTQEKFDRKYGKSISRGMVGARMDKLWSIGHIQKRQEEFSRGEGLEPGVRNIYYVGDEEVAPISEDEKELVVSGKFTKRKFTVMFRNAYSFHKPKNRFEEAIFDVMSDPSDVQFPASFEEYKQAVAISFTEEIGREDRLRQLFEYLKEAGWSREAEAYTYDDDIQQLVIQQARAYSAGVWESIKEQMKAQQKMAQSGMQFNQAEYDRLVAESKDYYKSVKEMKKEGKL